MTDYLLYVLGFLVLIQLFYYLYFFSRLAFYDKSTNNRNSFPGVTVLVCAWNERQNLEELIPMLDAQEYPNFEVILLDDRSDDGSEEFVRNNIENWKHIRYIRINNEFDHITPKKYALTVGMKHAKNPVALMTDADCRPTSSDWITSMTSEVSEEKDIVLGFSPYYKEPGALNWFIRCETFYTAVQYLSLSLGGFTYMGVGRNILYKRSIFFASKGFYRHRKIFGGDDDLFLNEVSTESNTAISLETKSFMYSVPKKTWKSWYNQKQRHLSVSKYYKLRNKLALGGLSGSHVGVWIAGITVLAVGIWEKDLFVLSILSGLFLLRWLVQWFFLSLINNKLDKTMEWFSWLLMDFALFAYYIVFGFLAMVKRKPRTKWN